MRSESEFQTEVEIGSQAAFIVVVVLELWVNFFWHPTSFFRLLQKNHTSGGNVVVVNGRDEKKTAKLPKSFSCRSS
jgi:hypothetical protein